MRDGADDQDHDDIPNVMELSRIAASGLDDREPGKLCTLRTTAPAPDADEHHPTDYGRVNPFNPCLPHRLARTCPKIVQRADRRAVRRLRRTGTRSTSATRHRSARSPPSCGLRSFRRGEWPAVGGAA